MRFGPIARPLLLLFAGLFVLFLTLSARAVLEARAEAAHAEVALAAADVDGAIVRLRASARWYAPLNFYASDSLAQLEQIASAAEKRGEHERALSAWRAIHASIHATRSFYIPHTARLARADERIAALMAAEPPAAIEKSRSPTERKADYLALLSPAEPRLFGVLLAITGFLTWVGSATAFLSWGVDSEGRVLRGMGRRSVVCLLLGWIMFAVGLRIA